MQIKVTRSDGYSWHSAHVGEVFEVTRVTYQLRGDQAYTSYEVDLTGRHHDAIAGTISARDCQVVDWTDAPQSMEIERLTAELEALRIENAELKARIAEALAALEVLESLPIISALYAMEQSTARKALQDAL